ncbi:hypothetical protein [Planobispora longispora]|uniref:Uncharacterized protein n=1 Tax=Planobispora longispora TaxID=28887 RepID=A0A8J3W364_9ACTN|nr:hypothetical protein [Planobispora longispora]BFE77533.1 hypothetical protein GCM10020093_001340 [Planobispora longispora]GIH73953.1 hypothetical protein Plo01_03820 [Planobispora longispora]
MLAIAAAIVFGIGLLFELLDASLGGGFGSTAFLLLGLLLLSLHQAGVGTAGWRGSGTWRRSRR